MKKERLTPEFSLGEMEPQVKSRDVSRLERAEGKKGGDANAPKNNRRFDSVRKGAMVRKCLI